MRVSFVRRRVHWALALASALATEGCCSTSERIELVDHSGPAPRTVEECERVCRLVGACTEWRVARCAPATEPNRLTCVYTVSECPEPPGPNGSCGRRHADGPAAAPPPTALPALLASLAALEAESVPAFERLAEELAAHLAPSPLVRAARRGAQDERRHAAMMAAQARRRGAVVSAAPARSLAVRPLREVALENAREGCVGESFGALLAAWCAARADDAALRETLSRIARDEAAHAALAWSVDAWVRPRLDAADRDALDAAHRDARASLQGASRVSPEARRALGWPDARERAALTEAFLAQPWGRA